MNTSDDYNENCLPGIVTAVAALALALENNGGLRRQDFGNTLRRLRDSMPEDEAVGESGAVIERVLEALADARKATGNRANEADTGPAVLRIA